MDLFGKQHAANLRVRTWKMEEFETYFGEEGKKKGNSDQFQAVTEALKELKGLDKTSGQAWLDASDKLMTACQTYSDSHKGARSAGGRERLAIVESLSEYQLEKSRQHAGDLRNRQWNLEKLETYIRDHQELAASSPEFRAVSQAFGELAGHRDEPITRESAMEMIKASDKLKKACQAFSESTMDSPLASSQEYLGFIDGLSAFHEGMNLDQARDMRVVREHQGKTWGQVGSFKIAEVVMDKTATVVGANVSQRLQLDYEGKKGFFTERFELKSQEGYVRGLIEEIDRMEDPGLRRALEENQQRLINRLNNMAIGEGDSMPMKQRLQASSANLPGNRMACCIGEYWNQMEENEAGRKQKLGKEIIGNHSNILKVAEVVKSFQENVKDDMTEDQKSGLMERTIREKIGKDNKELKKLLTGNKDFLMGVPSPDPWATPEKNMEQFFKLGLIQAKAADPVNASPLDRLIDDDKGIRKFVSTAKAVQAAGTASSAGYMDLDQGMELTGRNIASTRIAELLGIGHIIAHSEKMIVRSGDKVMTGCFMEQAEGLDTRSASEKVQRFIVEKLDIQGNAGLYKDSMTMETFDYLCGQHDRHGGNMFYKLSEPDANGKCNVVGLQGIDNDLAFSNEVKDRTRGHVHHTEQVFIDKNLAEQVRKLDRETLEYAIGDVIPASQIDAMMERVQRFQKHMEDMIEIEGDKWDLENHIPQDDVTKLSERDKLYMKGLKSLQESVHHNEKNIGELGLHHKAGQVGLEINSVNSDRAKKPKVALNFNEAKANQRQGVQNPRVQIGMKRGR